MGIPLADVIPEAVAELADVTQEATDAPMSPVKLNRCSSDAVSPGSTRKRPGGKALEDGGDQQPPSAAKKRKTPSKAAKAEPEVVLVDGGEPQVRKWRICSENKVTVRKSMAHDSEKLRYLPAGEEFECEGPYKIDKKGKDKVHWLKLMGDDAGFVCTCSSKDAGKMVASLVRKQSSEVAAAKPDVALLIKPDWCKQILEKGKVWEIRGEICNRRGRFAIGASSTGTLVGEATMVNCLKVGRLDEVSGELKRWGSKKLFIGRPEHFKKHRIKDLGIIKYPKVYAWVMDDVVRYKTPVPYKHPQGAIKWIKLDETTTAEAVEDEPAGYESSSKASSSSSSSSSSSVKDEEAADNASPKSPEEVSDKTVDESPKSPATVAKEEVRKTEVPSEPVQPSPETKIEALSEQVQSPPEPKSEVASAPVQSAPEQWRVVVTGTVTVRAAKDTKANVLSNKKCGAIVSGRQEDDWLVLEGEPGFIMIRNGDRVLIAPACETSSPAVSPPEAHHLTSPSQSATKGSQASQASPASTEEVIGKLRAMVSSIKAGGVEEPALQEMLQSLLLPSGGLGNEPVKVIKETEAGLLMNNLRKQHASPNIKALASQVMDHWKDAVRKQK